MVPHGQEQCCDFVPQVALQGDFPIFGGSAYSTFHFQRFSERGQVVLAADKSRDEGDLFPASEPSVDRNDKLLAGRDEVSASEAVSSE